MVSAVFSGLPASVNKRAARGRMNLNRIFTNERRTSYDDNTLLCGCSAQDKDLIHQIIYFGWNGEWKSGTHVNSLTCHTIVNFFLFVVPSFVRSARLITYKKIDIFCRSLFVFILRIIFSLTLRALFPL